jgi:hypothetical protein
MPEQDSLSTIAEVAVGLAGFSGIALALTANPPPYYLFRVVSIIAVAVVSIALALLPAALTSAGWQPQSIWRLGSGVLVALTGIFLVLGLRYRKRAQPEELNLALAVFIGSLMALSGTLQLLNFVGLIWMGAFSVFYVGLIANLLYCGTLFIGLVTFRPR